MWSPNPLEVNYVQDVASSTVKYSEDRIAQLLDTEYQRDSKSLQHFKKNSTFQTHIPALNCWEPEGDTLSFEGVMFRLFQCSLFLQMQLSYQYWDTINRSPLLLPNINLIRLKFESKIQDALL